MQFIIRRITDTEVLNLFSFKFTEVEVDIIIYPMATQENIALLCGEETSRSLGLFFVEVVGKAQYNEHIFV